MNYLCIYLGEKGGGCAVIHVQWNLSKPILIRTKEKYRFRQVIGLDSLTFTALGNIFSAPEPKAQVHYCDHALSVVRRPSASLSVVNFSHFRLHLWNRWTDRKNKMAALASDWLRHFRLLLWNRWTEFNEFVFFGPIGKTRWPPWPLIGLDIYEPVQKARWRPWPLIGWDIFDFSSETAERNSTKLDRKQDLNILYQVCVFRADRKNKMAALASDWLRHFRILIWNGWTEFKETRQEARSQRLLPSLCFSSRSEKQDGRPGLWLA